MFYPKKTIGKFKKSIELVNSQLNTTISFESFNEYIVHLRVQHKEMLKHSLHVKVYDVRNFDDSRKYLKLVRNELFRYENFLNKIKKYAFYISDDENFYDQSFSKVCRNFLETYNKIKDELFNKEDEYTFKADYFHRLFSSERNITKETKKLENKRRRSRGIFDYDPVGYDIKFAEDILDQVRSPKIVIDYGCGDGKLLEAFCQAKDNSIRYRTNRIEYIGLDKDEGYLFDLNNRWARLRKSKFKKIRTYNLSEEINEFKKLIKILKNKDTICVLRNVLHEIAKKRNELVNEIVELWHNILNLTGYSGLIFISEPLFLENSERFFFRWDEKDISFISHKFKLLKEEYIACEDTRRLYCILKNKKKRGPNIKREDIKKVIQEMIRRKNILYEKKKVELDAQNDKVPLEVIDQDNLEAITLTLEAIRDGCPPISIPPMGSESGTSVNK